MGAKLPRSVAQKRVLYGTRPMTAKELARKLRDRCLNSFGGNADRKNVYYVAIDVGPVFSGGPIAASAPGSKFSESHGYHFSIAEEYFERDEWGQNWVATIYVTQDLDVFAQEVKGKVPRSILACALSD